MLIDLEELKSYLRIDGGDEDEFLAHLNGAAESLVRDVARIDDDEMTESELSIMRLAVLFAAAYMYEHREEADYRQLTLSLRAQLFGIRRGEWF
ncbi:MAG: head-tail connector protein [Lachnospiraceae bacterium]|nr:head-tail connector protein [Ruminococcus sp.]MCM1276335.1 head-tail connector protein [Lachnospiraceae bacterium]